MPELSFRFYPIGSARIPGTSPAGKWNFFHWTRGF